MLSPKRVKFRRPQKGKNRGMANSGNYVAYGTYGMKALESGWISSRQMIEIDWLQIIIEHYWTILIFFGVIYFVIRRSR